MKIPRETPFWIVVILLCVGFWYAYNNLGWDVPIKNIQAGFKKTFSPLEVQNKHDERQKKLDRGAY